MQVLQFLVFGVFSKSVLYFEVTPPTYRKPNGYDKDEEQYEKHSEEDFECLYYCD
jgi:hypothetical protein